MTTNRPYRRAVPSARARRAERCAGTQFDPTLTRLFVEVWGATVRAAV